MHRVRKIEALPGQSQGVRCALRMLQTNLRQSYEGLQSFRHLARINPVNLSKDPIRLKQNRGRDKQLFLFEQRSYAFGLGRVICRQRTHNDVRVNRDHGPTDNHP